MNKFISILFLFISTTTVLPSYAQLKTGSLGFNYSALIRDTAGRVQPLKSVKLRFTLLMGQNGATASSPWIETQNPTTDAYGFVNVTIGNGTKYSGTASSFANVDFTLANYWILIEVYNTATSGYDPLAKEALQAVPYAKVAGAVVGAATIPPGTIVAFGGDVNHIPAGWLLCDGRQLDNTNPIYSALFNAIQYNWGTSNHANYFNVPYTNGRFLRGANNGAGGDPDAAGRLPVASGSNAGDNVGSYEPDAFQGHGHNIDIYNFTTGVSSGGPKVQAILQVLNSQGNLNIPPGNAAAGSFITEASTYVDQVRGDDVGTGVPRFSTETRPKNVYVNYIIKL